MITLPDGSTLTLTPTLGQFDATHKFPGHVPQTKTLVYDTPSGVATVSVGVAYAPTPPNPPPTPTPVTEWITPGTGKPAMSDAAAAALVGVAPENIPGNAAANAYVPPPAELAAYQAGGQWNPLTKYVTGTPGLAPGGGPWSTDMLIQWASLKWGIPTDWMRAEMWQESQWGQSGGADHGLGDAATVSAQSYTEYPVQARIQPYQVYQSMGISQVKWDPTTNNLPGQGAEPLRWKSTAFNLDLQHAYLRMYYDGLSYLGPGTKGQEWDAVGDWFEPSSNGSGGAGYVANVQAVLAAKPWL